MAESYALSEAVDASTGVAPEERGSLTISTTAVEHLAEAAARTVSGTVARSGVLRKVGRRVYPRAQASIRGERVWLVVAVASEWPCAISSTTAEVRDRVLAQTKRLSGLSIECVDVTMHVVGAAEGPPRRVQ